MNDQRKVVYEQRRDLITTNDINQVFLDMLYDTVINIIENNISEKNEENINIENISNEIKNLFGITISNKAIDKEPLTEILKNSILDKLNKKIELIGKENFSLIQKQILIQILDQQWKAHL